MARAWCVGTPPAVVYVYRYVCSCVWRDDIVGRIYPPMLSTSTAAATIIQRLMHGIIVTARQQTLRSVERHAQRWPRRGIRARRIGTRAESNSARPGVCAHASKIRVTQKIEPADARDDSHAVRLAHELATACVLTTQHTHQSNQAVLYYRVHIVVPVLEYCRILSTHTPGSDD